MDRNISRFAVTILLSTAFIVSACQAQLLPPMSRSIPEESLVAEAKSEPAISEPEIETVVEAVEEPIQESGQKSEEATIIDVIVKAIEEPTESTAIETVATKTFTVSAASAVPSVEMVEVSQPAVPAAPLAYVTGAPIRIHAGPGTSYVLHGVADQGTTFALVGQAADCQWYQVQHPALGTAWIAGTEGNVTIYNATCPQLPLATN